MTEPRDGVAIQHDAVPAQNRNPSPRRWPLILGAAILAILIGALIVVTTPPPPVPEAILIRTDRSLGTFIATGDAVDSGRMCDGGVYLDQHPASTPRPPADLLLESAFICADRSAFFRIRGEVVESDERFNRSEGTWRFSIGPSTDTHFEGEGRFFADNRNLRDEALRVTYVGEVNLSP